MWHWNPKSHPDREICLKTLSNYEGTVNVNRSKNSIGLLGIYYRSVPVGQRPHGWIGELNRLECGSKERCLEFHV